MDEFERYKQEVIQELRDRYDATDKDISELVTDEKVRGYMDNYTPNSAKTAAYYIWLEG